MLPHTAAIEECAGKVEALHAELCELLWRHVCAVAANRPDVSPEILHGNLMIRTGGCRCAALKKIADPASCRAFAAPTALTES
jgi:hypothetical protein